MSSFDSNSTYICSLDNAELIDIYDPNYDDDDYLKLPENFDTLPLEMKETLRARHQTLVETLDRINNEKRERYLNLISNKEGIILICPVCKKVYDSVSMLQNQDLYHGSNNQLPVRKPKRHGVVSDDRESVSNARDTILDYRFGARQVFFPDPIEEELDKDGKPIWDKDNRTVYKQTKEVNPDKIKHASIHLKNLSEKYGKDNLDIQINIPE